MVACRNLVLLVVWHPYHTLKRKVTLQLNHEEWCGMQITLDLTRCPSYFLSSYQLTQHILQGPVELFYKSICLWVLPAVDNCFNLINSAVCCNNSNKNCGVWSWIIFRGTPCCHITSHRHFAPVLVVLSDTANTLVKLSCRTRAYLLPSWLGSISLKSIPGHSEGSPTGMLCNGRSAAASVPVLKHR